MKGERAVRAGERAAPAPGRAEEECREAVPSQSHINPSPEVKTGGHIPRLACASWGIQSLKDSGWGIEMNQEVYQAELIVSETVLSADPVWPLCPLTGSWAGVF